MTAFPKQRAHGFTLVELLVVIGIIALLISILLPSLNKARNAAYSTQCQSMLRQFGNADAIYMNMNKGWHIPAWFGVYNYNHTWPGFDEFRKALGMQIMDKSSTTMDQVGYCYVDAKYYCPKTLRGIGLSSDYPSKTFPGQIFIPMNYSYGMNVEDVDDTASPGTGFDAANAPYADTTGLVSTDTFDKSWKAVHGYKSNKVKRPAEKLFIADAMWIGINESGSGPIANRNYDNTKESTATTPTNSQRTIAWRHPKGYANILFFDGHAATMNKEEIYNRDATGTIIANDRLWKVFQ